MKKLVQIDRTSVKEKFFFILLSLIISFSLFSQERIKSGLDQLEEIVSRVESLEDFLNSEDLLKEYKSALDDYYGVELPQESFDQILEQLQKMIIEVPELAERLWSPEERPEHWKEILVETKLKTHGRILQPKEEYWRHFHQSLATGFFDKSRSISALTDPGQRKREVRRSIDRLEGDYLEMLKKTEGLGTRKARTLKSQWFKKIEKDPRFSAVIFYLLERVIKSEAVQDLFRSRNADQILDFFYEWENLGPGSVSPFQEIAEVPPRLFSVIARFMPKAKTLLDKVYFDAMSSSDVPIQLFPRIKDLKNTDELPLSVRKRNTSLRLRNSPRRLHLIWEGIKFGECVGGDPRYLYTLTPERWALSALENVESFVAEERGKHKGSLKFIHGLVLEFDMSTNDTMSWLLTIDPNQWQVLEEVDPQSSHRVVGLDLNGEVFNRMILMQDEEDGLVKKVRLSEHLLRLFLEQDQEGRYQNVVLHEAVDEPQNTRAIYSLKQDDLYAYSRKKSFYGEFSHDDELSEKIARVSRDHYEFRSYFSLPPMVTNLTYDLGAKAPIVARKEGDHLVRLGRYKPLDFDFNFERDWGEVLSRGRPDFMNLFRRVLSIEKVRDPLEAFLAKKLDISLLVDLEKEPRIFDSPSFWEKVALEFENYRGENLRDIVGYLNSKLKRWPRPLVEKMLEMIQAPPYLSFSYLFSYLNRIKEHQLEVWKVVHKIVKSDDFQGMIQEDRQYFFLSLRYGSQYEGDHVEEIMKVYRVFLNDSSAKTRQSLAVNLRFFDDWNEDAWDMAMTLLNDSSAIVQKSIKKTLKERKEWQEFILEKGDSLSTRSSSDLAKELSEWKRRKVRPLSSQRAACNETIAKIANSK